MPTQSMLRPMADPAPLVINMWSGPRNISTALMYSWRQRADTVVFDEPFYGHYLSKFDPGHPGMDEITATMELDVDKIVASIVAPGDRPVRYIKNIGHHLDALDPSVLGLFSNVLLVRDPIDMVASLTATIGDEISVDITGMPQLGQVLDFELNAGRTPIVIESKRLRNDPQQVLTRLCDRLGLAFDDAMLSWPAGSKPEDGVWAKHWYDNAHASTEFVPYVPKSTELNDAQRALADACQPHYERLLPFIV